MSIIDRAQKNPRIVGTITSLAALKKEAVATRHAYDVAELRLDLIGVSARWQPLAKKLISRKVPVLLTIRSAVEGGQFEGPEKERIKLYLDSLPHVSAVDVEIRSKAFAPVSKAAHAAKVDVVGSYHDFEKTPDLHPLLNVMSLGHRGKAAVVKIAAKVSGPGDVAKLFMVQAMRVLTPLCLIGMGEEALYTRVAFPCAGSCLAYGYVDKPAAPGQLPCADLGRLLKSLGKR